MKKTSPKKNLPFLPPRKSKNLKFWI
ncbi:MAG: hypothetical protein H7A23_11485 [Leptospiraceae bacterium]|nr:hypothetical protein [Leptospiraceae bacterium]MCP5495167.1 hypothetical protein [Leptospiraceae bacterium]